MNFSAHSPELYTLSRSRVLNGRKTLIMQDHWLASTHLELADRGSGSQCHAQEQTASDLALDSQIGGRWDIWSSNK